MALTVLSHHNAAPEPVEPKEVGRLLRLEVPGNHFVQAGREAHKAGFLLQGGLDLQFRGSGGQAAGQQYLAWGWGVWEGGVWGRAGDGIGVDVGREG